MYKKKRGRGWLKGAGQTCEALSVLENPKGCRGAGAKGLSNSARKSRALMWRKEPRQTFCCMMLTL